MKIVVVSASPAWERYLLRVLHGRREVAMYRSLDAARRAGGTRNALTLLHAGCLRHPRSTDGDAPFVPGAAFGVAADAPSLDGLFAVTRLGARAYFNGFMADVHYTQLLELMAQGQSWYPPALLASALELARHSFESAASADVLQPLTPREREIALDVARGMSNREVASLHRIAESSVKTHLTRIFKKLRVKSRTELSVACSRRASVTGSHDGGLGTASA